jgi:predicted nucleic acid-binding protein
MTARLFVIDTNVLVAGLISSQPSSPTVRILDAMLDGQLLYLLSPELLSEYREVLLRTELARLHGLDEQQADPGDDHLWALLTSETGAILVTGDRLLLEHPRSEGTVIKASACAALLG